MSRRSKSGTADAPTIPAAVGEGRAPVMDKAVAAVLTAANQAAGFPAPPIAVAEAAQAPAENDSAAPPAQTEEG